MSILLSDKLLKCISEELSELKESVLIISAYCKLPLIKYFDSFIKNVNADKTLVVRFRPDDIISGSSDLELYSYCKDNGWKLYFRLDLHAKTYVFDRIRCIIGSANATSRGMHLGGTGNFEVSAACQLDNNDQEILRKLLFGSVEMNDDIFMNMQDYLKNHVAMKRKTVIWPDSIETLFPKDYSVLFSEDFPDCVHPYTARNEDFLFLGVDTSVSDEEMIILFKRSKCYLWLLDTIRKKPSMQMSFGELSKHLHSSILNDPKPYRKDVKQLLGNLLNWITDFDIEEIKIERPNYSQVITYRNGSEGIG